MSREERVTGIWLVAGLAIVFAVDSLFPLGVASGMLYVPLLLLCQPANGRRWLLPVTGASTVLIDAPACKRIQRSDDAWQIARGLHPGELRGLVLATGCARRAWSRSIPSYRPCSRKRLELPSVSQVGGTSWAR